MLKVQCDDNERKTFYKEKRFIKLVHRTTEEKQRITIPISYNINIGLQIRCISIYEGLGA